MNIRPPTRAYVRRIGGVWYVESQSGLKPCASNSEAWRTADKMNREALSRQEDVHEWSSRRNDNG